MAIVWIEPVINRTLDDVLSATTEFSSFSKGAYSAMDLNRVLNNIQYLAQLWFDETDTVIPLPDKLEYKNTEAYYSVDYEGTPDRYYDIGRASADILTYEQSVEIINTLRHINEVMPTLSSSPSLGSRKTLEKLTYIDANNIELILLNSKRYLEELIGNVKVCGTFSCGEVDLID